VKTSQAVLALAVVVTAFVCTTMAGASSTSSLPPGRMVNSAPTSSSAPFMFSLFTAAADGSGARQITGNSVVSVVDPSTPLGGDMNPRWSPDGNRIAFTRLLSDNLSSVYVVNADGRNLRLVSRGGYSEHPKWSPDGRWIAFQEQLMHGYQGVRGRPELSALDGAP
jgi:dipeptidyl aminopeptidase/acylaminoacyl peptidase